MSGGAKRKRTPRAIRTMREKRITAQKKRVSKTQRRLDWSQGRMRYYALEAAQRQGELAREVEILEAL